MITVHGDTNATYQLLYGGVSDNAINAVQQRISSLASAGLGLTTNFIESTKQLFNTVGSHDVIRAARRAVAGVATFAQGNTIQVLNTVEEFQLARPYMQRLLAADPWVREKIHNLELDGWSDSYVDKQPGVIGMQHYEYRLTHNGLKVIDEKEETWQVQQFFNHLKKDDVQPTMGQIFDLKMSVINLRRHYLAGEEDPTSIFGEEL